MEYKIMIIIVILLIEMLKFIGGAVCGFMVFIEKKENKPLYIIITFCFIIVLTYIESFLV